MDTTVNIGTQLVGLQGQTTAPKQDTGHPGLDSISHSVKSDLSTMPPSPHLSGGDDPVTALKTIVGTKDTSGPSDLVIQPTPKPQPPVTPRGTGPSPLPTTLGPVTPQDPRPMADKTLPPDWANRMKAHAEGTSGHFRIGPHQTEIRGMMAELGRAAARGQGDGDVRSLELSRALSTMLSTPYTAEPVASDGAKGLRQAHMTLVALVQHARDPATPTAKQDVLRAVMLLPVEQRQMLLEADLAGDKALTGLLHEAKTEATGKAAEDMKALFAAFKAASNLAHVTLRLDRHDPTGQASAIVSGFVDHLEASGVSASTMDAFANHLAFQLKLGDLKLPDTSGANWQKDLTLELISRFAGLEEKRPGELPALLKLPKADLLEVMGRAMSGRMEGDVHILRVLRDDMPALKALFAPDGAVVETLFKRLESGAYDAKLFTAELRKGSDLPAIATALEQTLDTFATDKAKGLNDIVTARGKQAVERFLVLSGRLVPTLDPQSDARARIDSEMGEIKVALKELGTAPLLDRIAALEKERDGDPLASKPPATGERLETIRQQLTALTTLRDDLAKAPATPLAFTKDSVKDLALRFGQFRISVLDLPSMGVEIDGSRALFKESLETLRQLRFQIDALARPEMFKTGVASFAPILPTVGKPLETFHHVDSMVQGLVALADEIRRSDPGFSLEGMPIVILDQSDGDGSKAEGNQLWDRNDSYLKGLEAKYGDSHGLTFVHVKMQDIRRMIDGSGLEKLFDTTGQNNLGYGGARNLAFLLGPVIRDAVLKGQTLADIKPGTLADRIKASALDTDAPRIFMGDDTDYLGPGTMFAKVGLNARHGDEYYTAVSRRDGRDTTNVASSVATGVTGHLKTSGTDAFVGAFANGKFNDRLVTPGMGSVVGAPRFCFDVPTGGEESHHKGLNTYKDQLGTVRHLSGDRMRDGSGQVASYLNYALGTETFMQFGAFVSSWNDHHRGEVLSGRTGFTSLGDVFDHITDPTVAASNQRAMFEQLAIWVSQPDQGAGPTSVQRQHLDVIDAYLAENPQIDSESRAELLAVRATFENAIRQGVLAKKLVLDFVERLAPGAVGTDGLIVLSPEQVQAKITPMKVLAEALGKHVDKGTDIAALFDASKKAVLGGIDLKASENVVLRNLVLVIESIQCGGFTGLVEELV